MSFKSIIRINLIAAMKHRNHHGLKQRLSFGCHESKNNYSTFAADKDRFNGLTIDTVKMKFNPKEFTDILEESLSIWLKEGRRCIWFKIDIKKSNYVPILAQKGFNFHHARDDYVMMYKWLPKDSEPNLPPASYTNLGVGAVVFNDRKQLLAVSEKHYEYPHWKLPGGYVERGEDIVDAAKREVKEETGVDSSFVSLVTFRHTHNMMYGNSDIYILLRLKALSDEITISQREVKECIWMDIHEYINHPHVHMFNKLILKKALLHEEQGLQLDIEKMKMRWSIYERDINFLTVKDM